MGIFPIGGVCDRKIGEGIDANVFQTKLLSLGLCAVVIHREGTLGKHSDRLGDGGLTQTTERRMRKAMGREDLA